VIAAVIAIFGLAATASAQKDAAEKAREGGVEHWIEYYRAEQRKPSTPPAPESTDRTSPGERAKTEAAQREDTRSKQ
jgi:hypothetical protein